MMFKEFSGGYSSKEELLEGVVCGGDFLRFLQEASEASSIVVDVLKNLNFYSGICKQLDELVDELGVIKIKFEDKDCEDGIYRCESLLYKLVEAKDNLLQTVKLFEDYNFVEDVEKQFQSKQSLIADKSLEELNIFYVTDPCVSEPFLSKDVMKSNSFPCLQWLINEFLRREEDVSAFVARHKVNVDILSVYLSSVEKGEKPLDVFSVQSFFEDFPSPYEVERFLEEDLSFILSGRVESFKKHIPKAFFEIENILQQLSSLDQQKVKGIIYGFDELKVKLQEAEESPEKLLSRPDIKTSYLKWVEYVKNVKKIWDVLENKPISVSTSIDFLMHQYYTVHHIKDRVSLKYWEEFKQFLEQGNLFANNLSMDYLEDELSVIHRRLQDIIHFQDNSEELWESIGKGDADKGFVLLERCNGVRSKIVGDHDFIFHVKKLRQVKYQGSKNVYSVLEEDLSLLSSCEYFLVKTKKLLQKLEVDIRKDFPQDKNSWKVKYKQMLTTRFRVKPDYQKYMQQLDQLEEEILCLTTRLQDVLLHYSHYQEC